MGVPACFPDRGGNAQLVWGLLVCLLTFGMYMMFQPFVERSDDHLSQLAQVQIFLTLTASIGLRMVPPDETLAQIVTILLFCIPVIALLQETALPDVLADLYDQLTVALLALLPSRFKMVDAKSLSTEEVETEKPKHVMKRYPVDEKGRGEAEASADDAAEGAIVPRGRAPSSCSGQSSSDGSQRRRRRRTAPAAQGAVPQDTAPTASQPAQSAAPVELAASSHLAPPSDPARVKKKRRPREGADGIAGANGIAGSASNASSSANPSRAPTPVNHGESTIAESYTSSLFAV